MNRQIDRERERERQEQTEIDIERFMNGLRQRRRERDI